MHPVWKNPGKISTKIFCFRLQTCYRASGRRFTTVPLLFGDKDRDPILHELLHDVQRDWRPHRQLWLRLLLPGQTNWKRQAGHRRRGHCWWRRWLCLNIIDLYHISRRINSSFLHEFYENVKIPAIIGYNNQSCFHVNYFLTEQRSLQFPEEFITTRWSKMHKNNQRL